MHDPDTDRRQSIGLFRYGLIADLLQLPPGGTSASPPRPRSTTPSPAAVAPG